MTLVAVAGIGSAVMARGGDSFSAPFDVPPAPFVVSSGNPLVTFGSARIGGRLITAASIVSLIVFIAGEPLILEGATITTVDGFSGVVNPSMTAGSFLNSQ